jgi:shikimate dehydrogenase
MDITAHTKLCGLLGNPVEHSLSPAIHNAAFQKLGLDFVYLAFKVEDLEGAVRGIRALGNLRGFSVTIPHKVAIIPFLDEVEQTAAHIGSVNTILVEQGKLIGHNTDASGALRALRNGGAPLKGQQALMIGTGGAARAIAFAKDLRDRTALRVEEGPLADEPLRKGIADAQVLLHCTPIGMHPKVDATCVPASLLAPHLTVMDIVYNPLDTRLLREAKAAGCKTIRGLEMFLHQAMAQFELWTGRAAPVEVMRAVLESRFS